MPDKLKDRVLEFVAIAKECPENLQVTCFELLLQDYLESRHKPAEPATPIIAPSAPSPDAETVSPASPQESPGSALQQDLKPKDLHIKARKFIQKQGVTIESLNELLYLEGEDFKPLYDDLRTTRVAEGQIRITLLQALVAGLKTGEFEADGEAVRAECRLRKSYDEANFAANFRNNANLFEGFESYKKGVVLKLSEDGRKELAELVKELAA